MNTECVVFDMEGTLTHNNELLPTTLSLLDKLDSQGVKTAVLSDLPSARVAEIFSEIGVDPARFGVIVSSAHYAEGIGEALKYLSVLKDKSVFITSSAVAVKVASGIGIKVCAVKSHFPEAIYKKYGASDVFADMSGFADTVK